MRSRWGTVGLIIVAVALCSFVWGLPDALVPLLRQQLGLSAGQTGLFRAAPVLLGALAGLTAGRLSDRLGGWPVLVGVLAGTGGTLFLAGMAAGSGFLPAAALLLGLGGAALPPAAAHIVRCHYRRRHGLLLGLAGAGTGSAALGSLLGASAAAALGWRAVLLGLAAAVLVLALLMRAAEKNLRRASPAAGFGTVLAAPAVRLFSVWYFVVFGGLIAFSAYLPKLAANLHALTPGRAGSAAVAFALVAAACRIIGGWLADQTGGAKVLVAALAAITALSAVLTLAPPVDTFIPAMLLLGAAFGAGGGAVFQLISQYCGQSPGTAAGIVTAIGSLGGFFPPLVMNGLWDRLGTYTPGFAGLAMVGAVGWALAGLLEPRPAPWAKPREEKALADLEYAFVLRAVRNSAIVLILLLGGIYFGSGRLLHFDPALYGYALATIVSALGITWRITAWLMRPATRTLAAGAARLLWRRFAGRVRGPLPHELGVARRREGTRPHPAGLIAAADVAWFMPSAPTGAPGYKQNGTPGGRLPPGRPGLRTALAVGVSNLLGNDFIFRRGLWQGIQHFTLMWGVLGSFAITVPLVFGWMYFEAAGETSYRVFVLGRPLFTMPVTGLRAWLIYNALAMFAVLTLIGAGMALIRRLRWRDAKVDQRVEYDLFPLYLLLAAAASGLAMAVSHIWLAGAAYPLLAELHQFVIVLLLLYLPFGKLWHIPMRPLGVAAAVYHEAGSRLGAATCRRCGKVYATSLQIEDVKRVLAESGLEPLAPDGKTHLSEYCPECRRVFRGLLYTRRDFVPEDFGRPAEPVSAGDPARRQEKPLAHRTI